eukprot:1968433-Prymnesium_polylepis.4
MLGAAHVTRGAARQCRLSALDDPECALCNLSDPILKRVERVCRDDGADVARAIPMGGTVIPQPALS